jgi:trk system potassium uptake protein TrkH
LILSFFGACAGSTGGGIKIGRMLILVKQGVREIYRLVHPNALMPIKIKNRAVSERVVDAIWAFIGVYLAIFYLMVLLLLASGLDYTSAWSATAASLNNLGPGLGAVATHYGEISSFAKWVLCWGMLLGRLEIFTLLVLFTPTFWRN